MKRLLQTATPANLLRQRDPWGNGAALWVLAAMVFVAPFAWWSVRQVDLENDVKNWLPSDDPRAQILDWYDEHFASEERVLISWNESAIDDPRVELFAERLAGFEDDEGVRREGTPFVETVVTPNDALARMKRFDVPREEALERLAGVLVGPGPLRLQYTEAGRYNPEKTARLVEERIRRELGLDVEVLGPAIDFRNYDLPLEVSDRLEAEEAARAEALGDAAETPGDDEQDVAYDPPFSTWVPHDARLSWSAMHTDPDEIERVEEAVLALEDRDERLVERAFFTPGSPAAMVALLTKAGRADRDETFETIYRVAEEVGIPRETLRMGGSPYAGHELNQYLEKVLWNADEPARLFHRRSPFLASLLVGVVLSFLVLRSVRLAVLVLVTAFYAMFVTVALVPVTGGSMNVVLVVMPTLLMVLTLSAAIHLCNYWRHAVETGTGTPVVDATRMATRPCVYAALTTAIGLLSLGTSPLTPVADFGFYSAIGCLILLVVVLYGLPSMMLFWPGRRSGRAGTSEHATWRGLGHLLCRAPNAVALLCLAVFVGSVYGLQWFRTETKVIRYFPDDTRVIEDYEFLEDTLAGIIPVEVVVRFDDDRDESDARQADDTRTFVDRMEVVRRVQERIASHPDISGTVSLASFFPVTEPLPADAGFGQKSRWNLRSTRLERKLKGDDADSARSYFNVADAAVTLPDAGTGGTLEVESGDELWRISAQVAIMTDLDYGQLVGDARHGRIGDVNELVQEELRLYPSADHVVTGMVPLFLRTQQAVLDSLITSFALAFAVIAVVMMLLLRSVFSGALAMLPNLLPVGVVFGLVSWASIPVDIGTMITASVALGIAVDGTLHLLTWFKEGVRRGLTRNEAVAEALVHCGPAMFQTSAVVGAGLLVLASADLLLVHRFGWLMAALIGTALVADVILLPALLAGPLGRLVERSVRPSPAPAETETTPALQPQLHATAGDGL